MTTRKGGRASAPREFVGVRGKGSGRAKARAPNERRITEVGRRAVPPPNVTSALPARKVFYFSDEETEGITCLKNSCFRLLQSAESRKWKKLPV